MYIRYDAHLFLRNVECLIIDFRNAKKNSEKFSILEIIHYELVARKTHFHRDRILVIGNQHVNK